MKRRICVVTGTRAEYGILHPILTTLRAEKSLQLQLVVTGMHLMKEFGRTVRHIKADGFHADAELDISYRSDTGLAMAGSVGKAVDLFAKCFTRLRPDILVLLGDRGEMLAAAIAASYLNLPIAHIHGGELSGHVDGRLRHAITKLSHLHFAATAGSAARLRRLGEEAWRIRICGAPALDRILGERLPARAELSRRYRFDARRPLALLVQHPVAGQEARAGAHIAQTIAALKSLGLQTLIVYPNADAGGRRMIAVIERQRHHLIQAHHSLPHKDYLGLLAVAGVLVGNSSSGIIEAPSFRLPVVNIGERQEGRERCANVIDVRQNRVAIMAAVKKALHDRSFRAKLKGLRNRHGDGKAGGRIVSVLKNVKLGAPLLDKRMTY